MISLWVYLCLIHSVCLCRFRSALPPGGHHSVQADRPAGHVLQSRRICQPAQHHQGPLHWISQSGEVMWAQWEGSLAREFSDISCNCDRKSTTSPSSPSSPSFSSSTPQETHQTLADKKRLHVVEFQSQRGPLPIVVATPKDGVKADPEREDEIPSTRLNWADVRTAQATKRSVWVSVKRTIW